MKVHDRIASAVQHLLQVRVMGEGSRSLSVAHEGIMGFDVWLLEKQQKLSGRKEKKINETKEKQQNADKPVFLCPPPRL